MAHPSTISLTLSAEVLRLPYPMNTRVVLAEIISLHTANGGYCYCSDAHLAARLTIAKDTVSVAVKLLVKDGLLEKVVDKFAGNRRILTPVQSTIKAKAASNPYPEIPGSPTRKKLASYPEIPGSSTRKNLEPLPGISGINTTVNITENLQQTRANSDGAETEYSEKKIFREPFHNSSSVDNKGSVDYTRVNRIRDLVLEMAAFWHINEIKNPRQWLQFVNFVSATADAGRLEETRVQFEAYRRHRQSRGIDPHSINNYLGSEKEAYADGQWCACDWEARATETMSNPALTVSLPPPVRARANPSNSSNTFR